MKCALCNTTAFKNVSNVDTKSNKSLLVSMCSECGLIQQNPIPTADELQIYYSHNYRKDYKNTYIPKYKHIFRAGKVSMQRIKFLNAENIASGELLDIGAGGGEFVYLTGKAGFHSQGIEPNIGYSDYANSEYGCNIMTKNLQDIQGKFDIVTAFHVLEHLPSPISAFEKLYSLLNAKGKLFVEVPWIEANDASPHNIYFKAHIFYFSVDTLIACASEFFDVKRIDTTSNLKILFQAKNIQNTIKLPSAASVKNVSKRLNNKGWFEYLFKGKGFLKPIQKIICEKNIKNTSSKEILDKLFIENRDLK